MNLSSEHAIDVSEVEGVGRFPSVFIYTGQDRSVIARDITHVRVDTSVKVLPAELFRGFTELVDVELTDGLKAIERAAFADCKSLRHIKIPESVVSLGESAFNGCTSLHTMTIPDKINVIEDMTFHKCTNLQEIVLREGLIRIGNRAFKCCGLSDSVKIPDSVTIIDEGAFELCDSLVFFELSDNSALEEIRKKAFAFCFALERIKVPRYVRIIGDEAFCNCQYLEEVELYDAVHLQELGGQAFFACHSLASIFIPSALTIIEEWTFRHCYKLTNITFGRNSQLEQIKEGSFFDCKALRIIQLPINLKSIGEEAFSGCRQLVSVELGDQVCRIEDTAFKNCYSLRNIAIDVYSISEKCFEPACHDLIMVFGSTASNVTGMKHRFDGLPIHKICYQQSYNPDKVSRRDELFAILCSVVGITHVPTYGNNQDCQGPREKAEGIHRREYEQADMTIGQFRSLAGLNQNDAEAPILNNNVDSLGMTPLHILACSSHHDLYLYQLIVEHEPKCLITEDKWGCLPVLYAVWLSAHPDILNFLILSQKANYPECSLSWESMVETLCRAEAPLDIIRMLFDLQQKYFPDHDVDWKKVAHLLTIRCSLSLDFFETWQTWIDELRLDDNYPGLIRELEDVQRRYFRNQNDISLQHLYDNLAQPLTGWLRSDSKYESIKAYRYLIKCSLPERSSRIGIRKWRADIATLVKESSTIFSPRIPRQFDDIHTRMVFYEQEYNALMTAGGLLELALWKWAWETAGFSPNLKTRSRLHCGAGVIIPNVLSYLVCECKAKTNMRYF